MIITSYLKSYAQDCFCIVWSNKCWLTGKPINNSEKYRYEKVNTFTSKLYFIDTSHAHTHRDSWACARTHTHIKKVKVKLATVVEGDQKAPFSIATTPRCGGGRYFFPWIASLYPWYVPYIPHTHTHTHMYIYIHIVNLRTENRFESVLLNLKVLKYWAAKQYES